MLSCTLFHTLNLAADSLMASSSSSPASLSFCCHVLLLSLSAWLSCFGTIMSAVTGLYVLGDSLVDVGNNNHLYTPKKANFRRHGIDFQGGKPTGRFSNGKNTIDFIAERLGLPSPPPYQSDKSIDFNSHYYKGLNFASAGAGISDDTCRGCLSLNSQIIDLSYAYSSMVMQKGNEKAQMHLAESIFVISIGSNDIIDFDTSRGVANIFHRKFVDSLNTSLEGQLQKMYNIGARKFIFLGTGAVGCTPRMRRQTKSKTDACNEITNTVSQLYNEAASGLLSKLKSKLPRINYSFLNTYLSMEQMINNPTKYGFTELKAACCGLGHLRAFSPCTLFSFYCSDRRKYMFWDFLHPTEAAADFFVANLFDGPLTLAYPMNASQLIAH